MAKRTVKKDAKTLGQMFGDERNVRFAISSRLARLDKSGLQRGYDRFNIHLSAGNIVADERIGLIENVQTYRIAKPDAPALI